jgi:hypothetical protein
LHKSNGFPVEKLNRNVLESLLKKLLARLAALMSLAEMVSQHTYG